MTTSTQWWRNLSINQQKTLEKKYYPHQTYFTQPYQIVEMWENEGKPEPQKLIPIPKELA